VYYRDRSKDEENEEESATLVRQECEAGSPTLRDEVALSSSFSSSFDLSL
jgi:hypothetical protein